MTNPNSKNLKIKDGVAGFGGAVALTEYRHLAIRNAIEAHRQNKRKPLSFSRDFLDE